MKMKRKALERCHPPKAKWLKPGILEWLDDLSKGAEVMWSAGTATAVKTA